MLRRSVAAYISLAALVLAAAMPCAAQALPEITAEAALVMDADTGEVIISRNIHKRLPPASTVKLVTAMLALERTKMSDRFTVSRRAASMSPVKVHLRAGDRVTVETLLYAMLLKSANDAASVIAEGIAGSESRFARMMTEKARGLGALDTVFRTANGLPAKGQYSTVYDLALILRGALSDRRFVDIASSRYATVRLGGRRVALKNSNKFLWMYYGAVAGKTGYTRRARDCYVGEAERGGRRLIVSILKSEHRWDDARALLNAGFRLAAAGRTLSYDTSGGRKVEVAAAGAGR